MNNLCRSEYARYIYEMWRRDIHANPNANAIVDVDGKNSFRFTL